MPYRFMLLITLALPALLLAQESSSKTTKPEEHVNKHAPPPTSDASAYRNPEFAFACKVPYGWVDRTQQMQDESADSAKAKLLLAVFERPPEVHGDTVNSAIVITAESIASYPGLKTAADYLGPLTELTTGKGFEAEGDPYEFPIASTALVRADFQKDLGKLTMHQSSLLLLRKDFVLSFTFIAGSKDEMDELIEKLSFTTTKSK